MRFIFSTGSLYTYGVDRCFELAAAAGFDGVELMVDARWDTRQPDHLRRLIERYGLPIDTLHTPFGPVPGWPAPEAERIQHTLRLAETLGAQTVVHHLPIRYGYFAIHLPGQFLRLPWPVHPDPDYVRWVENGYADLQSQTNVWLCIENMPAHHLFGRTVRRLHHWNTPAELTRFPRLTMDTTHLGTWGLDPVEVYAQWGERVGHVHLSNFDGREHRRPEAGQLRLDALLHTMAANGYNRAICFELHPDALDAGQPDAHLVGLLTESLAYCRAALPATAGQ